MNEDIGRSGSGEPSGSQASPEDAEASSPSVSIPNAGLIEVTDFAGFISALRDHMAPVFDEQRATWEREGPAAMAAFEATGATLSNIGGNCPVQAEGTVDGQEFYFRARGDGWEFWVGEPWTADAFTIDRAYGEGPYAAGWMPKHEAIGFIVEGIAAYRASGTDTRSGETEGLDPKGDGPAPQGETPNA